MTDWSPEEAREVERVEAGNPSLPNPALRYWLTDCFVCGFVSIRRVGAPRPDKCPNCGRAVAPVEVAQLGEIQQTEEDR